MRLSQPKNIQNLDDSSFSRYEIYFNMVTRCEMKNKIAYFFCFSFSYQSSDCFSVVPVRCEVVHWQIGKLVFHPAQKSLLKILNNFSNKRNIRNCQDIVKTLNEIFEVASVTYYMFLNTIVFRIALFYEMKQYFDFHDFLGFAC